MKLLAGVWLSLLLILCGYGFAQIVHTNKVGREEAIRIVSQLTRGMRHEDAVKVLGRLGLERETGGPSLHNTDFFNYDLTDGCYLTLRYGEQRMRGTNWSDYIAALERV